MQKFFYIIIFKLLINIISGAEDLESEYSDPDSLTTKIDSVKSAENVY